MNDEDYELQRNRAILAAFQTGRPVFADSDGEMRYVDGDGEQVPEEIGQAAGRATCQDPPSLPRATALALRAERWSRRTYILSIVAAVSNAVSAIWNPWQLPVAAAFTGCAVAWYRVNKTQRGALRS